VTSDLDLVISNPQVFYKYSIIQYSTRFYNHARYLRKEAWREGRGERVTFTMQYAQYR
jgi:hypothetical protein